MPPGLTLSSTGALSGTSNVVGPYSFTITATDTNGQTGSRAYTVNIEAPTLTLAPGAGTLNAPYGAAFTQAFTAGGSNGPFSYALTGTLPTGMSFSGNTLSGTPTTPGSYPVTVTATDTVLTGIGAPFSIAQNYTIDVPAPAITLTPTTLPGGTAAVAYSGNLSASGGMGPYTFAVTTGVLPTGVTLSTGGVLSGTPTASGSFAFTVTATDANAQTGTQAYTINVIAPTLAITPATLPVGLVATAYNQTLTASNGNGPYTFALTTGTLPAGLTLAANGALTGTPTTPGSSTFTVTATDSTTGTAGTGTRSYTLVINPDPPTLANDTATVLSGQSVVIAVTANDSGTTATSIAIAGAPANGTAVVNGLSVTYTPNAGFSGTDTFTYTGTSAGGTSAPATVTVTVNPLPVAQNLTATTTPVQVTLTTGATGGPFTGANVVAVTPAAAGSTSIAASGANYVLTFTPTSSFSGSVVVRYTLNNAFTTSAEGRVTITVEQRPDPSKDAEVQGLVDAQAESTRRFATGQISNFQQRMERLHRGGDQGGVENGIGFSVDRPCIEPLVGRSIDPCNENGLSGTGADSRSASGDGTGATGNGGPIGIWTGGMIRSGSQDGRDGNADISFETDGISTGVDYRVNESLVVGSGIGYGRDDNAIGGNGTRVDGSARTFALYASYHPGESFFLDTLFGYQQLDFDTRRYVTATRGLVNGQRDGDQWFASVSVGADINRGELLVTPYARFDIAQAQLDAYTETGHPIYALRYDAMDVDSSIGSLGLRLDHQNVMSWGMLTPQLRLEYQRDLSGRSGATMRYADLPGGPGYGLLATDFDHNRFMLGLGLMFDLNSGWGWAVEYGGQIGNSEGSDHGVSLQVQKQF